MDLPDTAFSHATRTRSVFEAIVDAMPAFALISHRDGRIEFINRAMANACLLPEGSRTSELTLDALLEPAAVRRLLSPSGISGLRAPVVGGLRPGTQVEWFAHSTGDDEDLVLITGRDISREMQLEDYIVSNQWYETTAALSGGLAHDFNNVLAAILGLAEIISLRLPPEDVLQKFAAKIGTSVDRAKNLVRRFGQFSRKGEGLIEAVPTGMALTELGAIFLGFLPGNVSFSSKIDPETPWSHVSRHVLEHILLNCGNFLRNRLRAEGGSITLESRASVDPSRALVELVGAGQDMVGFGLESIFELDLRRTSAAYESGAGLYTARLLAKRATARLDVERRDPRTIAFVLELPPAESE